MLYKSISFILYKKVSNDTFYPQKLLKCDYLGKNSAYPTNINA